MEFNTLFTGKNYIALERVDSTNNYAANLMKQTKVPDGTVILAHFQENGRGQTGNSWQSSPGQNIMTSVVYHFNSLAFGTSFLLSKAVSLAIFETVNTFVKQDVNIKWPNDIFVDDQKIAGILVENSWQGSQCSSIIGIGLNVNQQFFGDLNATSLANCTGLSFEIHQVLNQLVSKIEAHVLKLRQGRHEEIAIAYLSHLRFKDVTQQFQVPDGTTFTGKIIDVENSGHLVILDDQNETKKFLFKEVFVQE